MDRSEVSDTPETAVRVRMSGGPKYSCSGFPLVWRSTSRKSFYFAIAIHALHAPPRYRGRKPRMVGALSPAVSRNNHFGCSFHPEKPGARFRVIRTSSSLADMLKVGSCQRSCSRNWLVKGVRFDSWASGMVMQAVKVYNMREVDELVFLDVSATLHVGRTLRR